MLGKLVVFQDISKNQNAFQVLQVCFFKNLNHYFLDCFALHTKALYIVRDYVCCFLTFNSFDF